MLNNNLLNKNLLMKPNDMIDYLTSIKDYTIITINEKNKDLHEDMINNDMNVYYVNLNNIFDKDKVLDILVKKYKHLSSGEYLWVFYKGYYIGSRDDIYKIISKKYK
jgi:Flp pilus assembly CpaF family ATPase